MAGSSCPDGRVKHLHTIAHATRDKSGRLEYVGAAQDVTRQQLAEEQRKEAAEALQASERDLRSIIGTIPTMVWSSAPDGSVDFNFFNPHWLDYTGLPPDQTRDWRWTAAIHPDDLRRLTDAWQAILVSGEPGETEARIRRLDGVYRWFLFRANPLRDESGSVVKWYGIIFDIEERKRAEEERRRSEMELRQILDHTPQLAAEYGPNLERLYVNRTALDYFGVTLDEWRQRGVGAEIHPEDWKRYKAASDRALASGSGFELELRLPKGDGNHRWFLVRYNPVRDDKGQVMRWYVACTDIEDRKQAEERLRSENVALREEIDKASMFEEIVGTSPALQTVLSHISKVAPSDSTVLITGETGTGKELVARAIHRRSKRASRSFVSVNCAAIPRDLIASELFGHEKGAFTGATQQRLGRFELANGGTLFLDEAGELPAETQIALLRVLQEHEFERVGGTRPIRSDVRVIAATNRDLEDAINAGSFRSDLYYRLNVFPIEIPALRERKQDIPLLAEYFIDRYARKSGKKFTTIDKKTLRLLESYPWPGNIRELQNVIERSIIVCGTETFSVDESWLSRGALPPAPRPLQSGAFKDEVEPRSEREIIEAALAETRGRVSGPSGAAVKLGIPSSTFATRIKALKINKSQFKSR
jgi:formate hydrogenlyase transcriptional activator